MAGEGLRRRTDIELYRVRRTLSQVKRKLEEALRLSRHKDAQQDEQPASPDRRR
jgi:TfoX/Sxy family transcriptional regulator of competence genes